MMRTNNKLNHVLVERASFVHCSGNGMRWGNSIGQMLGLHTHLSIEWYKASHDRDLSPCPARWTKMPLCACKMAFCPNTTGSVISHHKVRQFYISRMIWHRISKFYANIHAIRIYKHTRYDVTSYFRPEVWKTAENDASYDFGLNILENGLSENHEILRIYHKQSAP